MVKKAVKEKSAIFILKGRALMLFVCHCCHYDCLSFSASSLPWQLDNLKVEVAQPCIQVTSDELFNATMAINVNISLTS